MTAAEQAARFIRTLPKDVPKPDLGEDPDGDVSMEWYKDRDNVLSVSINERGGITYAAMIGEERDRGALSFEKEVPAPLIRLIRRLI